jgi:hypothetical protein
MTQTDEPQPTTVRGGDARTVIIVGPDGTPIGQAQVDADADDGRGTEVADMVEQPAKVMRIGSMIKQLLEEVRSAPLDDASRTRLRDIYQRSIAELEEGLAPELREELERLSLPFTDDKIPSDAELRIAQAQLVGWLEGLFHGIQTVLYAQQMAARVQLEEIRRRALPAGQQTGGMPGMAGMRPGAPQDSHEGGQYL